MHSVILKGILIVIMLMVSASPMGIIHIWTFAAAYSKSSTSHRGGKCPCTDNQISPSLLPPIPSFVGDNYFCDTGSTTTLSSIFYPNDPLWDGQGCGSRSTCCAFNTPPWFFKTLSSSISDNLELRTCSDEHRASEDTPLEIIELYVQ